MRNLRSMSVAVAAAAVFLLAGPMSAAVYFFPACGQTPSNSMGQCGFAGKGDVQLALRYNNAQMQAVAGSLLFRYSDVATYSLTCVKEWETGRNRTLHTIVHDYSRTRSILSSVAYDSRKSNQVTGFFLTGLGGTQLDDALPQCPGGFRAFDAQLDYDINNDGFVVSCTEAGCTYTDASGSSDGVPAGPFPIYSTPTLTGSTGGVLTVQRNGVGPDGSPIVADGPAQIWPMVLVTP